MNRPLEFLLSAVFDSMPLDAEHQADIEKSGITDQTRRRHKIRTAPPDMIDQLAGFHVKTARSAYVIPFPDPRGGFFDHVKMKVFADDTTSDVRGDQVDEHREKWRYNGGARKYIVRRQSSPRLYFPLATLPRALEGDEPVWLVEGPKKSLAASQVGLPAVGIESAWGWHVKGSRALLPDFAFLKLEGRIVELVPDSDVATNPAIKTSMHQLADALRARGAKPRLVRLPEAIPA